MSPADDIIPIPPFIYGTAWKEDQTQRLTELALRCGFRGIDTANQRKHYDEAAVGRGIAMAIANGVVSREELFLQTKFTFQRGQDHRLPYDPREPIATQVKQSFASSLVHLGVEQIDSYVLHGPTNSVGLTAEDREAWQAMEQLYHSGLARRLGISNVSLEQLQLLRDTAEVGPSIVQNRCYASRGWDVGVRKYCNKHGIAYQAFSLLTANRNVLTSAEIAAIAGRYGRTSAQIIFRFAIDVGMIPLTGSTSAEHLQADLAIFDFRLQPDEIGIIERAGIRG